VPKRTNMVPKRMKSVPKWYNTSIVPKRLVPNESITWFVDVTLQLETLIHTLDECPPIEINITDIDIETIVLLKNHLPLNRIGRPAWSVEHIFTLGLKLINYNSILIRPHYYKDLSPRCFLNKKKLLGT